MSKESFRLRKTQGIPYYSCGAFESLPWLNHGFSTRQGGVSGIGKGDLNLNNTVWDSPQHVLENQRRFLTAMGLEKASLITLQQVHSNKVYLVEESSSPWDPPEGDALITRAENVALAVKTADCMPILIVDPVHRAIAAVHSGWRGTLSRILGHTIREMQQGFHSRPEQLLVAIGPGIRACCFEVGAEVVELFNADYPEASFASPIPKRPGKFLLDLSKALQIQLDIAKVLPENRHDLGACTCCNTREFFSYRSEGSASGRMLAVIGVSPAASGLAG